MIKFDEVVAASVGLFLCVVELGDLLPVVRRGNSLRDQIGSTLQTEDKDLVFTLQTAEANPYKLATPSLLLLIVSLAPAGSAATCQLRRVWSQRNLM